MSYKLNDKIIAKKKHPCGANEWLVIRTGTDYKLKCSKCSHVILVNYNELNKMTKKVIKES
jgi:hypothetical protein